MSTNDFNKGKPQQPGFGKTNQQGGQGGAGRPEGTQHQQQGTQKPWNQGGTADRQGGDKGGKTK